MVFAPLCDPIVITDSQYTTFSSSAQRFPIKTWHDMSMKVMLNFFFLFLKLAKYMKTTDAFCVATIHRDLFWKNAKIRYNALKDVKLGVSDVSNKFQFLIHRYCEALIINAISSQFSSRTCVVKKTTKYFIFFHYRWFADSKTFSIMLRAKLVRTQTRKS